ncbi:MAG: cytochrome c [Cypionkella sp.]|nr:cytochrome c [Cypionkella sp.]
MKLKLTALALGFALIGTAASADVASRQALMKTFGGAAKTLGGMAGGAAYDAAAAEVAKAALVDGAAKIASEYEENINDATSEAKPEVWTNWEDFLVKAKALGDAAAALDVTSAETIGAGMGGIGGACKDCHISYRMKK